MPKQKGGHLLAFHDTQTGAWDHFFSRNISLVMLGGGGGQVQLDFVHNLHAFKHLDAWYPLGHEFWHEYDSIPLDNAMSPRLIELGDEGIQGMVDQFLVGIDSSNNPFVPTPGTDAVPVYNNRIKIVYRLVGGQIRIYSICTLDRFDHPAYSIQGGKRPVSSYAWVPHEHEEPSTVKLYSGETVDCKYSPLDMSSSEAVALYQKDGAHRPMGEETARTLFDLAVSKKSFSRRPPVKVFLPGEARTGAAAAQQLASPTLSPPLTRTVVSPPSVKIPKSRLEATAAREAATLAREKATATKEVALVTRETARLAKEASEKVKSKSKAKPTGLAAVMKSANVTEESSRKASAKKAFQDANTAADLAEAQADEAEQAAVAAEQLATEKEQHADKRDADDKAKSLRKSTGKIKASRKAKGKKGTRIKFARVHRKRPRTVRRRRPV